MPISATEDRAATDVIGVRAEEADQARVEVVAPAKVKAKVGQEVEDATRVEAATRAEETREDATREDATRAVAIAGGKVRLGRVTGGSPPSRTPSPTAFRS